MGKNWGKILAISLILSGGIMGFQNCAEDLPQMEKTEPSSITPPTILECTNCPEVTKLSVTVSPIAELQVDSASLAISGTCNDGFFRNTKIYWTLRHIRTGSSFNESAPPNSGNISCFSGSYQFSIQGIEGWGLQANDDLELQIEIVGIENNVEQRNEITPNSANARVNARVGQPSIDCTEYKIPLKVDNAPAPIPGWDIAKITDEDVNTIYSIHNLTITSARLNPTLKVNISTRDGQAHKVTEVRFYPRFLSGQPHLFPVEMNTKLRLPADVTRNYRGRLSTDTYSEKYSPGVNASAAEIEIIETHIDEFNRYYYFQFAEVEMYGKNPDCTM